MLLVLGSGALQAQAVAPTITAQPLATSAVVGDNATFRVTATGTGLTYQWRKDGVIIPETDNSIFSVNDTTMADAGAYSVVVSNAAGMVTSGNAALTVTTTPVPATITTHPAATSVGRGANVTFSVLASGTAPLRYQWRKDGSAIAGADERTYTIFGVTNADAANYSVRVTNSRFVFGMPPMPLGNVTSNDAALTVTDPVAGAPTITTQPMATSVVAGASASLSVVATGNAPLTYQWNRNGNDRPVRGANSATYSITNAARFNAGTYTVTVSNSIGSVTSAGAALTVTMPPRITSQPMNQSVEEGANASFSVVATGDAPLTYQWSVGGQEISGATMTTYMITGVDMDDAGDYTVVVTNPTGTITSTAATLTVTEPVPFKPEILGQPRQMTVMEGETVDFMVVARGHELTYQWKKNGTDIEGATSATYTISGVSFEDFGEYSVVVTNTAGMTASMAAFLTIEAATGTPIITTEPMDLSVEVGANASFSVTATGDATLAYQWKKDGTDIAGATSATYSISSVALDDAGRFSVVVTNSIGMTSSRNAVLTVTEPVAVAPVITTQPMDSSVEVGDSASFSVTATGTGLSYQWRLDGTPISGATGVNYSISSAALTHAGDYTVVVTNTAGSVTSMAATLTVTEPAPGAPQITTQPTDVSVVMGESASFTVVASGAATLTYQWSKDGMAISGATMATYEIASTVLDDAGDYTVVVTNSVDTATSMAATLAVSSGAPAITTQPRDVSVVMRDAASFTVVATGIAPLTYQWSKDGTEISGATSATYSISSTALDDAGAYSVVVTNSVDTATSRTATLAVSSGAPAITTQPRDVSVVMRDAASFTVVATGIAPLTYQWSKDGTEISGATSATYSISRTAPDDAGTYSVVVTNEVDSVTSRTATLAVTSGAPAILSQPAALSVKVGSAASFTVVASGIAPLTYQWSKDGTDIAGATSATYGIAAAEMDDAGAYAVVVSNEVDSVTSAAAPLTVTSAAVAPEITTQPAAMTVDMGASASFTVVATGTAPFSYQWSKDGTDITGATAATYLIDSVAAADAGAYAVVVTNEAGSVTSTVATLTISASSVISNLSVRTTLAQMQTLIVGAVVANGSRDLLIRAAGPALEAAAAMDPELMGLPDPQITLFDPAGTVIGENDDWDGDSGSQFGAFPFAEGSTDSAYWLDADGPFTVHVSGKDGMGTVLAEIYVGSASSSGARLTNISARNLAGTGDDTLIAGFVIAGTRPHRVLIRVVGPTLGLNPDFAVPLPDVLTDPVMTVFDSDQEVVRSNDNWNSALEPTFASVGAFALLDPREAALVAELPPGAYTVHVSGADGGTGIALVEVYELRQP